MDMSGRPGTSPTVLQRALGRRPYIQDLNSWVNVGVTIQSALMAAGKREATAAEATWRTIQDLGRGPRGQGGEGSRR